jgi:hypothetical protein
VGQQIKVVIGLLHLHVWVCWTCGRWWVVFGVVVCPIKAAFIPVVTDMPLEFSESEPPEAEVHGLGLLWDNGEGWEWVVEANPF